MSADPFGDRPDLFADETLPGDGGAGSGATRQWLRNPVVWLAVASAVLSVVALGAALDDANGAAAMGVAAVGYLLAVLADVIARRTRYDQKNYRRPWVLVGLRVLTFALALWVGWEVASTAVGVA